jgi:hypothetical protein
MIRKTLLALALASLAPLAGAQNFAPTMTVEEVRKEVSARFKSRATVPQVSREALKAGIGGAVITAAVIGATDDTMIEEDIAGLCFSGILPQTVVAASIQAGASPARVVAAAIRACAPPAQVIVTAVQAGADVKEIREGALLVGVAEPTVDKLIAAAALPEAPTAAGADGLGTTSTPTGSAGAGGGGGGETSTGGTASPS